MCVLVKVNGCFDALRIGSLFLLTLYEKKQNLDVLPTGEGENCKKLEQEWGGNIRHLFFVV